MVAFKQQEPQQDAVSLLDPLLTDLKRSEQLRSIITDRSDPKEVKKLMEIHSRIQERFEKLAALLPEYDKDMPSGRLVREAFRKQYDVIVLQYHALEVWEDQHDIPHNPQARILMPNVFAIQQKLSVAERRFEQLEKAYEMANQSQTKEGSLEEFFEIRNVMFASQRAEDAFKEAMEEHLKFFKAVHAARDTLSNDNEKKDFDETTKTNRHILEITNRFGDVHTTYNRMVTYELNQQILQKSHELTSDPDTEEWGKALVFSNERLRYVIESADALPPKFRFIGKMSAYLTKENLEFVSNEYSDPFLNKKKDVLRHAMLVYVAMYDSKQEWGANLPRLPDELYEVIKAVKKMPGYARMKELFSPVQDIRMKIAQKELEYWQSKADWVGVAFENTKDAYEKYLTRPNAGTWEYFMFSMNALADGALLAATFWGPGAIVKEVQAGVKVASKAKKAWKAVKAGEKVLEGVTKAQVAKGALSIAKYGVKYGVMWLMYHETYENMANTLNSPNATDQEKAVSAMKFVKEVLSFEGLFSERAMAGAAKNIGATLSTAKRLVLEKTYLQWMAKIVEKSGVEIETIRIKMLETAARLAEIEPTAANVPKIVKTLKEFGRDTGVAIFEKLGTKEFQELLGDKALALLVFAAAVYTSTQLKGGAIAEPTTRRLDETLPPAFFVTFNYSEILELEAQYDNISRNPLMRGKITYEEYCAFVVYSKTIVDNKEEYLKNRVKEYDSYALVYKKTTGETPLRFHEYAIQKLTYDLKKPPFGFDTWLAAAYVTTRQGKMDIEENIKELQEKEDE